MILVNYEHVVRIIENNGYAIKDIAEKLDIQYQTVFKNLHNQSLSTVYKISEIINVNFIELLTPPDGYEHFFKNGKWAGIAKIGKEKNDQDSGANHLIDEILKNIEEFKEKQNPQP